MVEVKGWVGRGWWCPGSEWVGGGGCLGMGG